MKKHVTAVIRGVGERTEDLCKYILCQQLPEENIHVVHKTPSTEGTREVYRIGLEEDRKYTLFVDADQLLFSGSLNFLYGLAESYYNEKLLAAKGSVIDKIFMEERGTGCGPILYSTKCFEKMKDIVPDPKKQIRPDSFIINAMKDRDYIFIRDKQPVALHDYEQYYKDIYKKMIINSQKMEIKCKKMIDRWSDLSLKDKDYAVCIQGWLNGHNYKEGSVAVDYSKNYGYIPLFKEKEPIRDFESKMEELCLK